MGATVTNGPFAMPMMRRAVPRRLQPWHYVFMAVTFQLSGGLYLGTMAGMMGETTMMREDLLMCLYANLAGMAVYFPILFMMKFRFTNKTLLAAAATGVMACNLAAPHISFLPLLWAVCFVEGVCKIQGTFECMSTIQLWMTPNRDFTVFFPMLHIVILGSMQVADIAATTLMHHYHWTAMHWLVAGLMMADLLIITLCTRHVRIVKKFPLVGIDWLGALLWALLLLEVAYMLAYGDYHDWWASHVMMAVAAAAAVTLAACVGRMLHIRHPYIEPQMWTYRHLAAILLLITVVEMLLAAESSLEEVFYEGVMHYDATVSMRLDWPALGGIVAGCLFAFRWMHVWRLGYLRLLAVGIAVLACYLAGFYFTLSADIHISQLYLPVACRGFAYAVLSATFMVCLEEIMTFRHFFQALSVFNMLHMVVGGVTGSAIYTEALQYLTADNTARYGAAIDRVAMPGGTGAVARMMAEFVPRTIEVGLKQIYGWCTYACLALLLLFMLYDAPMRRELKKMPSWRRLRREEAAEVAGGHGGNASDGHAESRPQAKPMAGE